ncbi:MAG: PadR family transcriptional regulator [Firmicutes bacterium]|nr:PadR family transcriptional regulator [Bacillota bacterium]
MEVQLKKGLLNAIVLASLMRGDSYGYRIIQDITPVVEISESTLYPILRRLELQGALITYSREHNGRLRKYYGITREGREKLFNFTEEWRELVKAYDFIIANFR